MWWRVWTHQYKYAQRLIVSDLPEAGVPDELPKVGTELYPLEEQQMFLVAEPSLHPAANLFWGDLYLSDIKEIMV